MIVLKKILHWYLIFYSEYMSAMLPERSSTGCITWQWISIQLNEWIVLISQSAENGINVVWFGYYSQKYLIIS